MNSLLYPADRDNESREFAEVEVSSRPWRSGYARDYGRVIHSAAFRRLQGKTQVFPGHESDFFRNRLTHSLEVAQIAVGIAERLNHTVEFLNKNPIKTEICATAALIHDLGHPPFGHNGERALDDAMRKHGGFEGNAQTLRIIARLEKKVVDDSGESFGLNLTYRTLSAALKYDREIPRSRKNTAKLVKGYYSDESELVRTIKEALIGKSHAIPKSVKTIECQIMDLADDIAYSTFDLEDSFKAEFLTPATIIASPSSLLDKVAADVSKELKCDLTPVDVLEIFSEIFDSGIGSADEGDVDPLTSFTKRYTAYRNLATCGTFRTKLSSQLVREAIDAVSVKIDEKHPYLSEVYLDKKAQRRVEVLKKYTYIATIYSNRVTIPEFRGYEVVTRIFSALAGEKGHLLMPDDVRSAFEASKDNYDRQMRIVCDFVAGMTDRYAVEFYGRLHSDSAQSMFKPI